jgi:PPM family protein phosphatase
MAELVWGASTHPGQIRPDNEDHMYAVQGVYVVADGMGGHDAGEVASALAVQRIREALTDGDVAPTAERVVEAITNANRDIFRAAIATPGQAGMGTTITVIAVIEDPMAGRGEPNIDDNDGIERAPDGSLRVTPIVPREKPEALVLANVGDSRTYLYRHARLRRVTVDHSYVQELVSTGHLTDVEARTHPRRNIITRALGIEPDVKVDWWTLPLVRGDRFVLCSDGLVDEVDDDAITATLAAESDPQKAVDALIALANAAGGRDNITVIVLDVLEGDDPPDPTQEIDLMPTWADDPTLEPALTTVADEKPSRRKRRRDRHVDEHVSVSAEAPSVPTLATPTLDSPTLASPTLAAPMLPSSAPAGAAAVRTVSTDSASGPKLKRIISLFVVLALLVAGFVAVAAWGRRGYFVDFNDSDQVVVYQGRPGGLLWFEPTEEAPSELTRDQLTEAANTDIDERPMFESFDDAARFVRELERKDPVEPTPDTSEPADTSSQPNDTNSTPTTPATTIAITTTTAAP